MRSWRCGAAMRVDTRRCHSVATTMPVVMLSCRYSAAMRCLSSCRAVGIVLQCMPAQGDVVIMLPCPTSQTSGGAVDTVLRCLSSESDLVSMLQCVSAQDHVDLFGYNARRHKEMSSRCSHACCHRVATAMPAVMPSRWAVDIVLRCLWSG